MHYTAWDSGLNRGFATYLDYRLSWKQLMRSSAFTQTNLFDQLRNAESLGAVVSAFVHPDLSIDMKHIFDRKYGSEVTRQFLDWHAAIGQRPFFAVLNYFDSHQPYNAPRQFQHFKGQNTSRYSAAIAYLDALVNSTFLELQRRNALDNTLVIVTSDHGELFEEHGLTGHAHNLYRNVLRVPLFLRFPPAVPMGQRVTRAVSLRDVPATILDLAALPGASVPGQSLRATWTDSTTAISPVLAEVSQAPNVDNTYPTAKGPMKSLFDDSTHYIRNGDSKEELYRFRDDSAEARNLSGSSNTAAAPWRARVDSILSTRQAKQR
jgi:arylsulfatase A-like enzyme